MRRSLLLVLGLAAVLVTSVGCGPKIDLNKLSLTDTFTGWYDFGVVDGKTKLVPSVTFRLQNAGDIPANRIELTVSFWPDGADGELDSKEIVGIGPTPVPPGAASDPILVRSDFGYTLDPPQTRAEAFSNSHFKDWSAKILAKRDGNIVRLGDIKIERRLIPHLSADAGRR